MNKKFKQPNIRINKVYTKTGDFGETGLVGGQRLPKDHIRIEAYGDVDELNSTIGAVRGSLSDYISKYKEIRDIDSRLLQIQHELFNLGTMLATLEEDKNDNIPIITSSNITMLETDIDKVTTQLPTLNSFTLPGGCKANIWLHISRTICRRAERKAVSLSKISSIDSNSIKYLNRLSDALFVWSRYVNFIFKINEVTWDPNKVS